MIFLQDYWVITKMKRHCLLRIKNNTGPGPKALKNN
jgi:hypothetical protein